MFYNINNLKRLGFHPDVIIDVGAYKGEWTSHVIKIFEHAKILMIEPQRSKETLLKNLAKLNPNILYTRALVGDKNREKAQFCEMETGSSIYEEQTDHPRSMTYYQMTTLNDVIDEFQLKGNYFIKLDVQGAEMDVLNGASRLLPHTEVLLLEVSLLNYNEGAPLFAEIIGYLNSKNFVLFDICDLRRKPDDTLFQADLIFMKRNSLMREKVNFRIPTYNVLHS